MCVQVGPGLPEVPPFCSSPPPWANVPGAKRWGNAGVGQHQARRPGISLCLICTFLGEKKVPAAVLEASLFLVCQAGLLLFAKNAGSEFRVAYREMLGIFRAKENEACFVFSS